MKQPIILVHGTQRRFLPDLLNERIWDNTTFFMITDYVRGELFFTLQMAIYHALSLEVQDKIIKGGYRSFYGYYEKNPWALPVISILRGKWDIQRINEELLPYYQHLEKRTSTHPYIKYTALKDKIQLALVELLKITGEDFMEVEDSMNIPLREGKGRFFEKKKTGWKLPFSPGKIDLREYKLVDPDYLKLLTSGLAENLQLHVEGKDYFTESS